MPVQLLVQLCKGHAWGLTGLRGVLLVLHSCTTIVTHVISVGD